MTFDPELEALFPENLLKPTLAQAASWTRLTSIVTAARVFERRTNQITPHFFLAFPDDELLEAVLVRVLGYFSLEYRCSREKLALAKRLDPKIKPQTIEKLAKARLNPTISVGGASVVQREMPQLASREPMRVFKVVDAPPMLELMFEPFQMLRTTIVSLYTEAAKLRAVEKAHAEKSGENKRSTILNRPYGDGTLVATLDALVYFALGMRVGSDWGVGGVSIESGFRCFNIIGQPPFQLDHFEVARFGFRVQMKELGKP